jgi:hypothetical protein
MKPKFKKNQKVIVNHSNYQEFIGEIYDAHYAIPYNKWKYEIKTKNGQVITAFNESNLKPYRKYKLNLI